MVLDTLECLYTENFRNVDVTARFYVINLLHFLDVQALALKFLDFTSS